MGVDDVGLRFRVPDGTQQALPVSSKATTSCVCPSSLLRNVAQQGFFTPFFLQRARIQAHPPSREPRLIISDFAMVHPV